MRRIAIVLTALAAAWVLAGCGEKPQQLSGAKNPGAPSWQGASDPFVAPGWTVGDQKSWETQLRNRAQRGQDEYPRTTGAS